MPLQYKLTVEAMHHCGFAPVVCRLCHVKSPDTSLGQAIAGDAGSR